MSVRRGDAGSCLVEVRLQERVVVVVVWRLVCVVVWWWLSNVVTGMVVCNSCGGECC